MIIERSDGSFEGVPEGCTVRRATRREPMYGAYPGDDPRDFTPDPECSTEAERKAHREACASWDRCGGPPTNATLAKTEAGHCHVRPGMVLCTSGSFGLGTYEIEMELLELVHPDGTTTVLY